MFRGLKVMYVCVCNAVTERQIHQAVKDGAHTIKHLKDTLGVAKDCARCVGCAKACIKEAQEQSKPLLTPKLIKSSQAINLANLVS
jgi:bacterioferritin-associated ferredoxin